MIRGGGATAMVGQKRLCRRSRRPCDSVDAEKNGKTKNAMKWPGKKTIYDCPGEGRGLRVGQYVLTLPSMSYAYTKSEQRYITWERRRHTYGLPSSSYGRVYVYDLCVVCVINRFQYRRRGGALSL